MRLTAHCTCGGVLDVIVPRAKRQQVLMNWSDKHSGPGHAPTTAAIAEMARTGSGQPDGREAKKAGKT